MIKWRGSNTAGTCHWKETAETYAELFWKLGEREIISLWENNPWELAVMEKAGKKESDFWNDDDEYTFYEWYEKTRGEYDLTEEEHKLLISEQKGNAYYQKFEEV